MKSGKTLGCLALAALLALGCKERPSAEYKAALASYEQLIREGRHPADPAFEALAAKLALIPPGAGDYAKAQALREHLTRSRAPVLERPLVTPFGTAASDPELAAQQTRCEALAKQLGLAPSGAKEPLRRQLAQCRAQQLEIEELRHSRDHLHHHQGGGVEAHPE